MFIFPFKIMKELGIILARLSIMLFPGPDEGRDAKRLWASSKTKAP